MNMRSYGATHLTNIPAILPSDERYGTHRNKGRTGSRTTSIPSKGRTRMPDYHPDYCEECIDPILPGQDYYVLPVNNPKTKKRKLVCEICMHKFQESN